MEASEAMGRIGRWSLAAVWALCVLGGCAVSEPVPAPPAAQTAGPWRDWKDFTLPGKRTTRYQPGWEDGRPIVDAFASASASMLRRSLRIAPADVAGVEFSWRVASLIGRADLRDADLSDSPARLVFAFEGDVTKLSMRNRMLFDLAQAVTGEAPPYATLMYVWGNVVAPETVLHSGRTDRVRKIVVQSGPQGCGRWLSYQRDLVADFRRAFGEEPGALIGVALMTDADNTASQAAARYGEVRLIGRDGRPF